MSWVGKQINDFYCNGYAGSRYDLSGAKVEAEAHDYVVIRTQSGDPILMHFEYNDKDEMLDKWTTENDEL